METITLTPSEVARFWSKVDMSGSCWTWTAATDTNGYGLFWWRGSLHKAHRIAFSLQVGAIPDGKVIDHRCRVKGCVNPLHLRAATHLQNMQNLAADNGFNHSSGLCGISWNKNDRAWHVAVTCNGRRHSGGLHPTLDAAKAAIRELRNALQTHNDVDRIMTHN